MTLGQLCAYIEPEIPAALTVLRIEIRSRKLRDVSENYYGEINPETVEIVLFFYQGTAPPLKLQPPFEIREMLLRTRMIRTTLHTLLWTEPTPNDREAVKTYQRAGVSLLTGTGTRVPVVHPHHLTIQNWGI
jgi:calcineurin-like phosphoesterase